MGRGPGLRGVGPESCLHICTPGAMRGPTWRECLEPPLELSSSQAGGGLGARPGLIQGRGGKGPRVCLQEALLVRV